MISDFLKGIRAYGSALRIISEMRLWAYLILPGILGLILAAIIGLTAWGLYDNLGAFFISWIPTGSEGWLGSLLDKGTGVITGVSNFISGAIIIVLGALLYKHLLIVILSPFMSPLAQKVEEHLTGRKSPYTGINIGQALQDILRGLRIAFRNIFRELLLSIPLILLGFIPPLSMISAILLFLVQANYAGFGNIDYTLERHYPVKDSIRFIRQNRGLALGNGTLFMLLISTGIGVFIAPTLATVAGAMTTVDRLDLATSGIESTQEFV